MKLGVLAPPVRPWRLPDIARGPLRTPLGTAALFAALATLFFLLIGRNPGPLFLAIVEGSFGGGYALSETLVKATPILLCALATALPARLGLISVGAEGQLSVGALAGTAFVLHASAAWGVLTLPVMLLVAAAGGAAWGALAGALRGYLGVNETITTLLLNYIAPSLVDYLVYGAWKDPHSLGWPATVAFAPAARLPTFFGTRVHLGLFLGAALALAVHLLVGRTRWGFYLDVLRNSPALAARARLRFAPAVVLVMAAGAACAGLAGMAEASVIEGRLQSGVGAGAGYSGFLVAWLARGHLLRLVPLSILVGGLIASGDNLQLSADLPSSTALVLQGLLFAAALVAGAPGTSRESA